MSEATALSWTASEMVTVAAARQLRDSTVCFVGIGLPSAAANLARLTHAPAIVLVYESGCIGAQPESLPLSIGDGQLADRAVAVVSVPEIFSYWLQAGRVDVGLLGAAQVDRYANLNSTVVGDYQRPSVRLPGAGGAPEIAAWAAEVVVVATHTPRLFVERCDFVTTVGYGGPLEDRGRSALPGRGPVAVVTDLGVLRPEAGTGELLLASVHPGVAVDDVRAATGWALRVAGDLAVTDPPTAHELATLRALTHL